MGHQDRAGVRRHHGPVARLRAARGDTVGAVAALDLVPPTSRGYGEARRTRADVILAAAGTDLAALNQALGSVSSVRMDSVDRDTLNVRIYGQALDAVLLKAAPEGVRIGEVPAEKDALRAVLEKSYRSLAREAATREERIALVDRANEVRPWTLT